MADQGNSADKTSPLHQALSVTSAPQEVDRSQKASEVAQDKTKKADTAPVVVAAAVEEGRAKNAVDEDIYKPPHLTYLQVFVLFIKFGLRAWGGPMAQIAMLKHDLVEVGKWVSPPRFMRAYAAYQVLPGPEATELCCYFGYIAKGRGGAFLAGLGFLLPGFCLMLLASYLYTLFGTDNGTFQASFRTLQPTIAALIFRAVHKIGETALYDHTTKKLSELLFFLAMLGALSVAMRVNFFITLGLIGVLNVLGQRGYRVAMGALLLASLGAYIAVVTVQGPLSTSDLTSVGGFVSDNNSGGLFITGLLGGLLSFGGAYTAVPFVQQATVQAGWITTRQFLDGLALGQIMPAPLVIFSTFVGFVGGGVGGAVLMTVGMFLPAMSFTMVGHHFFEHVTTIPIVAQALDGVSAAVTGFIAMVAFQLLRSALTDHASAAIFALSLGVLYGVKPHPYLTPTLVIAMAIAGQALYEL